MTRLLHERARVERRVLGALRFVDATTLAAIAPPAHRVAVSLGLPSCLSSA